MPDILLTCQNCQQSFVYSEMEQKQNAQIGKPQPIYCLICSAIKASEKQHPPKPKTN